jgi:hypothetical protein
MIQRSGFPHPGPLPVAEGVQGASLTISNFILAPMPTREEGSGGGTIHSIHVTLSRRSSA